MSNSDYNRGFKDGKEIAHLVNATVMGPDRTMYEFIGGPKHGQCIATKGAFTFMVSICPEPPRPTDDYWTTDWAKGTIRTGWYQRKEVTDPMRLYLGTRTIYIYQGEE